jgi:hypothetical protein
MIRRNQLTNMTNLHYLTDPATPTRLRLTAALGILIASGYGRADNADSIETTIDLDGAIYAAKIDWADGDELHDAAEMLVYGLADRAQWTADQIANLA